MLPELTIRLILFLPWFTILFMKKEFIKRYTPVATFSALLVTLHGELAYTQEWLTQNVKITDVFITFLPFTFGLFLVGTIWIFAVTFGRFWLFLFVNIVIDIVFAFGIHRFIMVPQGIVEELKHGSFEVFTAFLVMAIILYLYQMWVEEALFKTDHTSKNKSVKDRLKTVLRSDF
ncbi:hypothetical protein [Halalkalibacter alkalisediminis]|uniref:Uncharacterized protein n=1 Tax=Halalkalibacter alkalisediminis TaxID=935616 RepID=A0ABV6NF91_9BACI|nr:hypothetical protein [Halalkalibacter alkalisediminis]